MAANGNDEKTRDLDAAPSSPESGSGPPELSATELEVLKLVWDHAPVTVRQVQTLARNDGREWAYTTVLTLLQRLLQKGYVTSETDALAHQFSPKISREDVLGARLRHVAEQLYAGASAPLVLHLVQNRQFTSQEIQGFRNLLDQLSQENAEPTEPRPARPGSSPRSKKI